MGRDGGDRRLGARRAGILRASASSLPRSSALLRRLLRRLRRSTSTSASAPSLRASSASASRFVFVGFVVVEPTGAAARTWRGRRPATAAAWRDRRAGRRPSDDRSSGRASGGARPAPIGTASRLFSRALAELALDLEQRLLHRQAAAVAAEAAAAAQHPVAGDDERDRVAAAGGAGGADRARVAGLGGDLAVAAGLAVGDRRDPPRTRWRKPWLSCQSSGRSNSRGGPRSSGRARAAPRRAVGRLQDPRRDPPASSSSSASSSWFGSEPHQPPRRLRQQQRPEGRVGARVGDVEQALGGGALAQPRSAVDGRSCQLLSQS